MKTSESFPWGMDEHFFADISETGCVAPKAILLYMDYQSINTQQEIPSYTIAKTKDVLQIFK